jgi:hypothetical protein
MKLTFAMRFFGIAFRSFKTRANRQRVKQSPRIGVFGPRFRLRRSVKLCRAAISFVALVIAIMVEICHWAIEVLRRQPDGTWKLIVGDPNGRK